MSARESLHRWAPKLRMVSILVAVVAFFLIARAVPIEALLERMRTWVESLGIWGPVVFGLIYVVATVLMVPASVLTVASGTIFGLLVGTAVVSVSSVTGAALAFLIARYLLRERVAGMLASRPRLKAVDDAIDEGGWKIVAMLRLSPAVPFNLQNYLYGLTPIGFWPCVLASWIAMLPGTFLYVYLGYAFGEAVGGRERTIWEWLALGLGLTATVAVSVYVTKLARRKLEERTELDDLEPAAETDAEGASQQAGWPVGALVIAGVALVLVAAAVYLLVYPDALRQLVAGG